MASLKRITGAYIAATGSTLVAGWLTARLVVNPFLAWYAGWPPIPDNVVLPLSGLPVAWYSAIWAVGNLKRTLGVKNPVVIRTVGSRNVSVAGAMADAVVSALHLPRPQPAMTIAEEFKIERIVTTASGTERKVILDERWIDNFIKRSYTRQRKGETYPMSRNWWVDIGRRIRREEWELAMDVLAWCDLIHGSARRFRFPPLTTMNELKHRWGGWIGLPPERPEAW